MPSNVEGARRSQTERRAEAERRILDAAAELIGEIGPTRMTLAGIGERAGYSRGLTTHHFGSKGALIQRIIDTVTEQFHQDLATHRNFDSAVDAVQAVVATYFDGLRDRPSLSRARLALWADAAGGGTHEGRPAALESDLRFRKEISRRVTVGMESGQISRAVDVESFTTVLIAILRGVALQSLLDERIDLEACRTEVYRFVDRRLADEDKEANPRVGRDGV